MLNSFREKIRLKELSNLRLLNVSASVIVTLLGFLFEFAYHDGYILISGLIVSTLLTSNYFLSFYSSFYKKHFVNISFASVFVLHFWAVFVAAMRNFEIDVLLPVAISIFTFSLIFDKFIKSLFFIFTITTFMMILMYVNHHWETQYSITLIALYSGSFLSQEILKRKNEYQAEIRKQEGRYLSLVEKMNDGVLYISNDFKITSANDKFGRISGFTNEEIIGKPLTMLFDEEQDAASVLKDHSEILLVRKNKTKTWVQVSQTPVYDESNHKSGTMLVYTDINTLKETQSELRRKEEGYKTFIDQSAVGIWRAEYTTPININLPEDEQINLLLDSGTISECNDFMGKMYGYNRASDLIGRRIRDFYSIENNFDEEKTRELLSSFIRNNYRISNAESKEKDRNGITRYMLNNNIGIVENGFLIRTWGVQTDITERKKTERELVQTNQELDTFFYKASHDLKGPLASVMGIVNLGRLETNDSHMEKYFDMIETSVKRLDRTLLDLIELARTRKGVSKISTVNVFELTGEVLSSLKHLPDFKKVDVEIDINPSITLQTDKVLLLSVFQNLIHNAINYCDKEQPRVTIKIRQKPDGIELKVFNNGKGIPEHVKDKVFNMFYRGHADSPGSGLGLFIVKNAVEKMHGSISFESEADNGTLFTVYIPDASPEAI